jgi:hypothetical protein
VEREFPSSYVYDELYTVIQYTDIHKPVFCPCRSALVGLDHHSAKKATTQPKKVLILILTIKIMQNGIICLNLVEKM